MKKIFFIYSLFFLSIIISECKKPASIMEDDISGEWETIKGDYEYISFMKDNEGNYFGGFLHERLINSGTWTLKDGRLVILLDNGHKVTYDNISIKDGILSLNNRQEQYMRPRSNEQKVLDFLKELAKSQNISFSQPKKTDFNWNNESGDSISIKGQMITAKVEIKKDFSDLVPVQKDVVRFLENHDFYTSEMNISEIVTGYESPGSMKILIRTRTDPDQSEEEYAFIDIMCGII
jgi:hypothetical protein